MIRYAIPLITWSILSLHAATRADPPRELGRFRAEGFGATSIGGQGGRVIQVTNLADSGKGTLREALSSTGPRIIQFEVGGEIRLASPLFVVNNGRVTIDGRSALPYGGITLRNYGLDLVKCEDVIVTNIRQRRAKFGMGGDGGCFGLLQCKRVLLDHCSGAWSSDENFGAFRVEDVTFQWCISAEGLRRSGHIEGDHSCGIIVHRAHRVTLHHSLFVSNVHRNPYWKGNYGMPWGGVSPPTDLETGLDENGVRVFGHFDIRNNLFYNYGSQAGHTGFPSRTNFVGNVYRPGPSSPKDGKPVAVAGAYEQFGYAQIYAKDNLGPGRTGDDEDQYALFSGSVENFRVTRPIPAPVVESQPARNAVEVILRHAGAWPRDEVDARFVCEVRERKGQAGGSEEVQSPLLRLTGINQRQVYPFLMDNGPNGAKQQGKIRFRLLDAPRDLALVVDMNGVSIPNDRISWTPTKYVDKSGYWCEFPLAVCPPFKGENQLGVRLIRQPDSNQTPLLDELEIEIRP